MHLRRKLPRHAVVVVGRLAGRDHVRARAPDGAAVGRRPRAMSALAGADFTQGPDRGGTPVPPSPRSAAWAAGEFWPAHAPAPASDAGYTATDRRGKSWRGCNGRTNMADPRRGGCRGETDGARAEVVSRRDGPARSTPKPPDAGVDDGLRFGHPGPAGGVRTVTKHEMQLAQPPAAISRRAQPQQPACCPRKAFSGRLGRS